VIRAMIGAAFLTGAIWAPIVAFADQGPNPWLMLAGGICCGAFSQMAGDK
jgi:hypothetical protein